MVKMVTGCELGLVGKAETKEGRKVHQKTKSVLKITITRFH